jgi:hypothetical protein
MTFFILSICFVFKPELMPSSDFLQSIQWSKFFTNVILLSKAACRQRYIGVELDYNDWPDGKRYLIVRPA